MGHTSWQEEKMRIVFALLSLSALGHGKVLRDPAVDEYIAAILELLKTQMPAGIPDLGIPPLDPFEAPHFDIDPIDIDDPVPVKLNITIDDFVIKNLATFETQLAHLDLEGLGLELNLTIADLRGDATYSLDGTALGIFPIYGDGPMYLELYGVTLHAKAAGPNDLGPGQGLPLSPPGRDPLEGAERRPGRLQHCRPCPERQLLPRASCRGPQVSERFAFPSLQEQRLSL